MAEFDLNEYLQRRNGGITPTKVEDLLRAKQDKIAQLQDFRNAVAAAAIADPKGFQKQLNEQAVAGGRTWGEYGKDVALSLAQGLDSMAKLPAMAYDKATTGNFYGPETQAISQMSDEREALKSAKAQAANQLKGQEAVDAGLAAKELVGDGALGTVAQVGTEAARAFWEYAKDPSSWGEALANQIPQLGVTGKVGRVTELGAKALLEKAPLVAATTAGKRLSANAGTAGAVGFGAVSQGVDTGSDTMQRLMTLPDEVWAQNPEFMARAQEVGVPQAKQEISSRLASEATVKAGIASLATAALPGGNALEKTLVGKQKPGFKAVPKAFAGEATQEGLEEGSGAVVGNAAVKEINPNQSLTEGVGTAAGQGAFLGGLMGGGINAVGAVLPSGDKAPKTGEDKLNKEVIAAVKKAETAGDVSALTDPQSPTYSPGDAIAALRSHAAKNETTDNFEQASKIVEGLQSEKAQLQTILEGSTVEGVQKQLAKEEAKANPNPLIVEGLKARLEDVKNGALETTIADTKEQLAKVDQHIADSQKELTLFNEERQAKDLDVEAEVAKIGGEDVAASKAAADRIINLSMAAPERLNVAMATQLANDTKNGLSDAQRTYLRAFTAARQSEIATKNSEGVSKDIFYGGPGWDGITTHRANLATAIAAGNKKAADLVLSKVTQFLKDHEAKSAAIEEAIGEYSDTKQKIAVRSDGNRGWYLDREANLTEKQRLAEGAYVVNSTSTKTLDNINNENSALSKAAAEMQAAHDLKFSTKPQEKKDGTQATETKQAEAQGSQASESTGSTGTTTSATTEGSTKSVEASGLSVDDKTVDTKTSEVPLQSTEKTTTQSDVDQTTEESKAKVPPLSVLTEKAPEGSSLKLKKAGDLFRQQGNSPLTKVGNFVSALREKLVALSDYLPNGTEGLSDPQKESLRLFFALTKANGIGWVEQIQKDLKLKKNPEFNFKDDPSQYFIKTLEDGSLAFDENVTTAMIFAAVAAVEELANRGALNDDSSINALLGRDSDEVVTDRERALLANVGTFENVLRNSMGRKVMQALGLKGLKATPLDVVSKLESAFGAHVEKLLMEQGILVRSFLNDKKMEELFGPSSEKVGKFLKLNWNAENKLEGISKQIVDTLRGSANILQDLFHADASKIFPTLEPVKPQATTDNGKPVPSNIKKALEAENKQPNKLNIWLHHLSRVVPDSVFVGWAGGKPSDPETDQAMTRKSLDAKYAGMLRELDRMHEFVDSILDPEGATSEFFYDHYAGDTDRSYTRNNMFNPVTSKIHRYLAYRSNWKAEYTLTNGEAPDTFKLRVMEAFGIKTERQMIDTLLSGNDYNSKVGNPTVQAAIKVLQEVMYGDKGSLDMLSSQDQQTLTDAIAFGGEGLHTLAALQALAEQAQAVANNKTSFTSTLTGEVDGVANGVVISLLIYGGAKDSNELAQAMERGGIYTRNSGITSFAQWRSTLGNRDTYEALTGKLGEALRKAWAKANPFRKEGMEAVSYFLGSLENKKTGAIEKAGRNLSKNPLTTMMYGSAVGTSVDTMATYMIEGVISKINKAVKDGNDVERQNIIKHLNTLLGTEKFKPSTTLKQLLDMELTDAEVRTIRENTFNAFGKTAKTVLQTQYKPYLNNRDLFNKANQAAYDLFNIIYEGTRAAYVKELAAANQIEVNAKGEPLHDLTAEQEGELKKRLRQINPILASVNSLQDKGTDTGLPLRKTVTKQSTNPAYKGSVGFATPFPDTLNYTDQSGKSKPIFGAETVAQGKAFEGPGVRLASAGTHSLDASVSHGALAEQDADGISSVNVHDAHITGAQTAGDVARSLNKQFFKSVLDYSPMREVLNTLDRTLAGILNLMNEPNGLDAKTLGYLKDAIKTQKLGALIQDLGFQANQADTLKLQLLQDAGYIDQYASEGNAYEVTEDDRKEVAKRLGDLVQLEAAAGNVLAKVAQIMGTEVQATETKPQSQESIWGEIGEPSIKSDSDLVAFFEENPNTTAGAVIDLLMPDASTSPINRKLLALVKRVVNLNMPIRFVTPDTAEDLVLEKPEVGARGWFVSNKNGTEIYVLSPDFVNSGLTAETLIHELIHAAVAQVIANPIGDGKALVAELESLLAAAKKYATDNNLTGFDAALSNVQEFVAWGMTNLDFQKNVLTKVTMESKTKGNALVTAMQGFINALTKFFFKKPDENINNGLSVLIQNVSGLAYQAGQNKNQGSDLNLAQATVSKVDTYSTLEIHEALNNGTVEPAFQEHLANLLSGIVERLHGPFGAYAAQFRKTEAGNPLATWLKAMEKGVAPFASKIVASGFAGSAQEDFAMQQVEATILTALDGNDATAKFAYRELTKLYKEMEQAMKGVMSAEDYAFVFTPESNADGRSDYLARFAALGLANQKFNEMLKRATDPTPSKLWEGNSITDKLANLFERILNILSQRLTKTYGGQYADSKLEALVERLVDIEAKKRHNLKLRATETDYTGAIESGVKKLSDAVRSKIADAASTDLFAKSSNGIVQGIASLVENTAKGQMDEFMVQWHKAQKTAAKGRQSFLAGMATAVRGPTQYMNRALRMKKHLENLRKKHITNDARLVLSAFANKGAKLSKEAKAAVTYVVLRTGMHNLLGQYSMADLESLVSDRSALNKAIADQESKLPAKFKDAYIEQINGLGYFKATEINRSKFLMQNAHLIARLSGLVGKDSITEQEAKAVEPTIAALVSLYALRYSNKDHLTEAAKVFRTENGRPSSQGNGVEFLMLMHQKFEEESLARNFKGNPALMMHGFTPDITNQHTAVIAANAEEGESLIYQGYTKGNVLPKDPADPDTEAKSLYVLKDGGLAPRYSGIVALQKLHARGSAVHSGYMNVNTDEGLENAQLQAEITNRKLDSLKTKRDPKRDLSKESGSELAPIYNGNGGIVNWRYLMAGHTKDNLLERNNNFDQIMGVLSGSIIDKETSAEHNEKVMIALREQWEADGASKRSLYVQVGPNAKEPEIREIWAMLSPESRSQIKRLWGKEGMLVRQDELDILFGYRKYSVKEAFDKTPEQRKALEKLMVWLSEYLVQQYGTLVEGRDKEEAKKFAKRAAVLMTRGERGWQEIVRETKDIIVNKTGVVFLGNEYSNFTVLTGLYGVPISDVLKHKTVAWKSAADYQRDTARLNELENKLAVGFTQGQDAAIRREIVELKDSLQRNPVREYVEAGLLSSIVEDVANEEDEYSYKALLEGKVSKYVEKLPETVRKGAKIVYMSKETAAYKILNQATQLSDFTARYTLIQHLINKKNPMTKEEAIERASEEFVNYDVPMPRGLQYTDDMGLTMFTKYFLYIQRVLMRHMSENPARVLTMGLLGNFLDLGPTVLEGHWSHHLGNNPLRSGPLQYPGAVADLATLALIR